MPKKRTHIFKNYQENDKQFTSNINYVLEETASLVERNEFRIASSPQERVSKLKRLMDSKSIVRILESHNALTGLIIETLKIKRKVKNNMTGREYDIYR